ncbi:histidine kinase CKI1 [Ziziphus jujuba]|uniref:histidine kinase n=1 Tax=Ziziphus jujuba TaxID=326968 RepID=A0A6P3ZB51_ZIZJJ|nr:histidine kinase CKI1 [Ziziphus jujuba]
MVFSFVRFKTRVSAMIKMKIKSYTMKFYSRVIWRPICFVIIIGLSTYMIIELYKMNKKVLKNVTLDSYDEQNRIFSGIESTAKLLLPLNTSAINLARALSSSLNGTQLTFFNISTMVAPILFLVLSTIPHVSQVSYIGLDGIQFSYYKYEGQTFAVFSNSSLSTNWYTQPVDRDTGKLYGEAIASASMVTVNASWVQKALNSTNGYSCLRTGWNKAQDSLFLHSVAMDGRGVISLGFPTKVVVDHFSALDFHGGSFHLATLDGDVIVQTNLPQTTLMVVNNSVLLQTFKPNSNSANHVGSLSCRPCDSNVRSCTGKVIGVEYNFHCSNLEIAGVQSVYILAYPPNRLVSFVQGYSKLSLTLLTFLFFFILISLSLFIFLIVTAARREVLLCASLVKQVNSTQQAERKSMNKTTAFNRANHDVRGSLAAITGLIEICLQDANPDSGLAANLTQMSTLTKDLFGILNSVLDTSKIEAGKLQLEVEEFNLTQLLEDVVDMFYPVAIKKGVDVVLDPCDDSITKSCHVRGDRVKLKQILCNLLNNAVKFTSEGHVTIRARVKKTSMENAIIASNCNAATKFWSRVFYKNRKGFNDLDALHTAQQDPNRTEFVIEVDDTGTGIPKDKQQSVFENFVQVTETSLGQEGCGLGLGIVESLVRLMDGEIRIVDKEPGEKGTCFSFTVTLLTCKHESSNTEEEIPRTYSDRIQNGFQPFGINLRGSGPKSEGSHVVLYIEGDERRKVLTNYIDSWNIKVSSVKHYKNLLPHLEKIKKKLDFSYFNYSEKTQLGLYDYLSKSSSANSDSRPNDGSFYINDGSEQSFPPIRKTSSKGSTGIVLVVIDTSAGVFSELFSTVASFRNDIQSSRCKVVWLDNPISRNIQLKYIEEHKLSPPNDYVICKPFHGFHLYEVLGLLPELKGCKLPKLETKTLAKVESEDQNHSDELEYAGDEPGSSCSCNEISLEKIVVHKRDEKPEENLLNGKRILVVDDVELLRKLTSAHLQKHGAIVEVCENGKQAFDHVCKAFSDQKEEGHSKPFPYDYIFMDCEMPVMNGYEAARLIRMEEKQYGIHIPIIALTAHAMPEEVKKTVDAGMDFHLSKPLQMKGLLEALQSIHDDK